MRVSLLCVCVLAAACGSVNKNSGGVGDGGGDGGTNPGDDGIVSGTRLKVQWYDFGGTRVPIRIHDKMRDEDCNLDEWADGNSYCTPDAEQIVYSNAACTQRVGRVYHQDPTQCNSPIPAYFYERVDSVCGNSKTSHLFQKGASITEPGGVYYQKNPDGSCGGAQDAGGYDFYAVNVEVQPQMLAQLTTTPGTGAGRYTQSVISSQDGFSAAVNVHDTTLNTDCYLQTDSDPGTGVCVPSDAGYASYFNEATCATPVVETSATCAAPRYAVSYNQAGCPSSTKSYWTVGAQTSSTMFYYKDSNNGCNPTGVETTDHFFVANGALTLPSIPRSHDTIDGREIVPFHYHSGDLSFRDGSLYDTKHLTECRTRTFADGTVRCLPATGNSSYINRYYASSTCTTAIDLVDIYIGGATCGAPVVPKYALRQLPASAGSCNSDYEIHTVDTSYTGSIYQLNVGAGCTLVNDPYTAHYRIGPTVAASDFLSATVVQDP